MFAPPSALCSSLHFHDKPQDWSLCHVINAVCMMPNDCKYSHVEPGRLSQFDPFGERVRILLAVVTHLHELQWNVLVWLDMTRLSQTARHMRAS